MIAAGLAAAQLGAPGGQLGGQSRRLGGSWPAFGAERQAIDRRGDHVPLARLEGHFHVILGRQAVGELSLAIAAPDDAVDRRGLGPLDRQRPLARDA